MKIAIKKTSRHIIENILYTERREKCPIFATGQSITGHEKQIAYEKISLYYAYWHVWHHVQTKKNSRQ